MDLHLHGRCAVVCAASKGLGKATALSLAREGAAVAICSRSEGPLRAAADEIAAATGATVVPIVADVGTAADCDRLISESARHLGAIDILVTTREGRSRARSRPSRTMSGARRSTPCS